MNIQFFASVIILLSATLGFCATYYVDGRLSANCDGTAYHYDVATRSRVSGAGQIAWRHVSYANPVVAAGDTVFIRGGTNDYLVYTIGALDTPEEGIHPDNSGTDSNHRITYATYQGEKVHFMGSIGYATGISISAKNWIKITGCDGSSSSKNMKFSTMQFFVRISDHDGETSTPYGTGGSNNEISYCEFGPGSSYMVSFGGGSKIQHNSVYNWIHHCSFHTMGGYTENDAGTCFDLGWEDCGVSPLPGETCPNKDKDPCICTDNSTNNVIENNEFYHGGHQCFTLHNRLNVLRNNILHNEQWYQASDSVWYGYRVIQMQGVYNSNYHHGYNLIEGNRISHGSNNYNTSSGGTAMHLGISNMIIRYNDIYANAGNSIYMETHTSGTQGRVNFNHIYNNTFFANGYGSTMPTIANPPDRVDPPGRSLIYATADPSDISISYFKNVIKNNLSWRSTGSRFISSNGGDLLANGIWEIANNDTLHDPKLTSEGSYAAPRIPTTNIEWYWPRTPDGSDITKINTEPNFNLQATSPVIDSGAYLTLANGSGSNATTLIVNDAKYFQPGWGNGAGGGASVQADWIAIGTVSNTVQIKSIAYDSNKITLVSPVSWPDKAPVWLYKKSDGAVVLYGNAPDYGAHEYSSANYVRTVAPSKRSFVSRPMTLYSLRGQVVGELKGMGASVAMRKGLPPGIYFVRTPDNGTWRFVKFAAVR